MCGLQVYARNICEQMSLTEENSTAMVVTAGNGTLVQLLSGDDGTVSMPVVRNWHCEPTQARAQLEDAVYEQQELFMDGSMSLLLKSDFSTIVAKELIGDDDNAAKKVMALYDLSNSSECFMDALDDADGNMLLYTMPQGVRGFLERCFPTERVCHRLVPFYRFVSSKSEAGSGEMMWADLYAGGLDVVAFRNGRLVLLNSWGGIRELADAAYYLAFAWQTSGFDAAKGKLIVSGDAELRTGVMPLLRRYVNYVTSATLPREIKEPNFKGVPLGGLAELNALVR